jgi:hypothetical protein
MGVLKQASNPLSKEGPKMDRNASSHRQQRARRIERRTGSMQAMEFFNVLTSPELVEATERLMPQHRERLYPPAVTLSMFMRQALQADGSCQNAVNGWAAQRVAAGLGAMSVRTGAYCRARQRLPQSMVKGLARESGRLLSQKALLPWRWRGRAVKLVDGTGLSMPDTEQNQAAYPQPASQATGVGFPLTCMVVVICLATGAVLEAANGPYSGKGSGELGLFRSLGAAFQSGDVVLADALYCNYFLIATLMADGVDMLFEQHGSRHTDFRRGRRLGPRDHVVCWSKPARPAWMTHEQYKAFPDEIELCETRVHHQVLVTTLVEHCRVKKQELSELYARRWNVELDLRNLKTTMGMETLHCQTPEMNEKELWVHLLAYNLIRLLMAQAASIAQVDPRTLSYKHTCQLWNQWISSGLNAGADASCLFMLIAQVPVGNRPGRIEPRMRKRRPKSYPWLQESRSSARERVRKYGHSKRPK